MPRNAGTVRHLHELTAEERLADGDGHQLHWYKHVAEQFGGGSWRSVLDVGASTGRGMRLLEGFDDVDGIDLFPVGRGVSDTPIEAFPADAFDLVTAIDVIEHVEDDAEFLYQLNRVARCAVFLTTPNYNISKCTNAYHVREYTPEELGFLIEASGFRADAVWVSNAAPEIKQRPSILASEPWHNFGVLINV